MNTVVLLMLNFININHAFLIQIRFVNENVFLHDAQTEMFPSSVHYRIGVLKRK